MIVLSAGMPRAGTGWYYNLTHDLMLAGGAQDGRKIRERYRLQGVLTEVNCNIGALTLRRLLAVLVPSLLGNTFVIKAHAAPTRYSDYWIRRGWMQAAYIYRDPRDALLSALENGGRARQAGRTNAFSHLVDFETGLDFMLGYVRIWEAWMACEAALHARYEDLLMDYSAESGRLVDFLPLKPENPSLERVLEGYRPENTQPDRKGLHFSAGKIGRFRQKLSPEQQATLELTFKPYLSRMGYPV